MKSTKTFSTYLESFFLEYLLRQRQASTHTVASYRDTFRLLLGFAEKTLKKTPSILELSDVDAVFIGAFLDSLEKQRNLKARSRNQRLAAIRSFFRYVAYQAPEHSGQIQRVLAMPNKRHDRALVPFLTRPEMEALLAAPNRTTRTGRRDHALLLLAVQTGLRVSEITSLCCKDIVFGVGAHVRCMGKGRKERCTPLTKQTVAVLRWWLQERQGKPENPVFPNARGQMLTTDGVQYLLKKYVTMAQEKCPSLKTKRISPHVLRHTTAMQLLQSGVDSSVIALWLGHESVETTQMYLKADLKMKEEVLKKTTPPHTTARRFQPDDRLMTFLAGL